MSSLASGTRRVGAAAVALATSILVVLSGLFVAPAAYAAETPSPTVTVTPSTDLDPGVEHVLTVSGAGFVGAGAAMGAYVLVGETSVWSGGAPLNANGWLAQAYVSPRQIVDGAFTTTLTVPAGSLDPSGEYHVATSAAHMLSATDRSLDTFTPITVQQPAPEPVATTTALEASAASLETGEPLTLTANVAPAEAAGSVSFIADGSELGSAPVANGAATLTTADLAVGTHSIVAEFVSADEAAHTSSASAAVNITVTAAPAPTPSEVTARVFSAEQDLLTVSATVTGATQREAADVPDTGKADAGVYFTVIEHGTEADLASGASTGIKAAYVWKGMMQGDSATATIELGATELAQMDRTKQYDVYSWRAHGVMTPERYLGSQALAITSAQWDAVLGTEPEAAAPSISARVVDATEAGLEVSAKVENIVLRAGADVPDSGRDDAGVYVGIIEKDHVDEYRSDANAGAAEAFIYKMFITDGTATQDISVPAEKLDRTKQYVAVSWLAHGFLSDSRFVAQSDLTVSDEQWNAVFPKAETKASVVANVKSADETGLVITSHVTGLDASALPNGVHVGVLPAAVDPLAATTADFVSVGSVRPADLPASGEVILDLTVPASALERGAELQVLVWQRHTNPSAETNLAHVDVAVSDAQWNSVFPVDKPAARVQSLTASAAGLQVNVTGTGFDAQTAPAGAYVAVVEQGVLPASPADAGVAKVAYVPAAQIVDGAFTTSLLAPADVLDRTQQYQALVWKAHGPATEASVFARLDLTLTQSDWNAVFGPVDQPKLTVTPSTGLADGDTVTVRGSGFDPEMSIYVTTCADVPLTEVSFKFISGCTEGAELVWKHGTNRGVEFAADGSFELQMPVVKRGEATALYTIADHNNMDDRSQDAKAALSFADSTVPDPEPKPEPEQPSTKVSATASSVTAGKHVVAHVTADKLPIENGFAYVAVIEQGTAADLTQDSDYPAMTPFAAVKGGKLTLDLEIPAAKLDRAKQYEVLVWKQHTLPTKSTIYGQTDLQISTAQWDTLLSKKPAPEQPKPKPRPTKPDTTKQAGALVWGVSQGFKDYVTGRIAKGSISTEGVGANGGAYLFPQASGGSWNAKSQTGSVQFSGVVTFTGHHGLLTETFANPVITVSSATQGSISVGGRTFGLDLGVASKSVGKNGEVTWTGVPVNGAITGGGSAGGGVGGGSFAVDPLSFTVGSASQVNYGSTTQSQQAAEREAAATPPATTGITLLTDPEKLVPGGDIEFTAPGFESNERDVLVVLYSDPIVLDSKAGADVNGQVRWIGKLPQDIEPGEHTITLQGSTNAGLVITVNDPNAETKQTTTEEALDSVAAETGAQPETVAGVAGTVGTGPMWLWWVGAGALVLLALALAGLVVNQRRNRTVNE